MPVADEAIIDQVLSESVKDLSLKDLRALISEGGLSAAGCVDKTDLRERAKGALARLKLPGASLGPIARRCIEAGRELEDRYESEDKEKARSKAMENEAKKAAVDLSPEAAAKVQAAKEKAAKEAELQAKEAKRKEEAAQIKAQLQEKARIAKIEAEQGARLIAGLRKKVEEAEARAAEANYQVSAHAPHRRPPGGTRRPRRVWSLLPRRSELTRARAWPVCRSSNARSRT